MWGCSVPVPHPCPGTWRLAVWAGSVPAGSGGQRHRLALHVMSKSALWKSVSKSDKRLASLHGIAFCWRHKCWIACGFGLCVRTEIFFFFSVGLYLIHVPCIHLHLDGLGEPSEWSLCFSKRGQGFTPTLNLFSENIVQKLGHLL